MPTLPQDLHPGSLPDLNGVATDGILEFLPSLDIEEVGATLSRKSQSELDSVVSALQALLKRARKEQDQDDEADPDDEDDEPKADDDEGDDDTAAGARKRSRYRSRDAALPPFDTNAHEAATLGAWLESRIHSYFTTCADDMYGSGRLTRDERIALSSAIGNALDAFTDSVMDEFPDAYSRQPWADPDGDADYAEAKTKRDGGQNYPASDYAYVPDPSKPSTWKLRLTSSPGGAPDAGIVGAAAAALGPGFRGRKVQIPSNQLARVKAKVRSAWRRANPDKADDDMPDGIREAEFRHFAGEEVPFAEAEQIIREGKGKVRIIAPGWGSSGFYPPDVLKRDGPKVFGTDTHMYVDHPSRTEERDRPERSIKDLAGIIRSMPEYLTDGPEGEGLYADIDVLSHWAGPLKEMAPHIGVSIRGAGVGSTGEKEGRKGFVFERLTRGDSVDFVTHAGAGGKVLDVRESALPSDDPAPGAEEQQADESAPAQEVPMPETNETTQTQPNSADIFEELRQRRELDEARDTKMRRMQEQIAARDALDMARRALAAHQWPDEVKRRIIEKVVLVPPTTDDGDLDRAAFETKLNEAIDDMTQLATAILGPNPIRGMGTVSATPQPKVTEESATEALRAELKILYPGYSDAAIEAALSGR